MPGLLASPTPARTSPRCARAPSSATTTSSSAARRRGSRGASTRAGAACWRAPKRPPARSTEGISMLIVDMRSPGVEHAPDDPDHRPRRVLRALPRRRRRPEGEPAQRARRRLEDRHAHARPRARHRRAAPPGQAPHVARPRRARRRRRELDGQPIDRRPGGAGRARAGADRRSRCCATTPIAPSASSSTAARSGPDSSSVKLLMAEAEQRLAATALDVLGRRSSTRSRPTRRERLLGRDLPLLARGERLRRHAADPAQHHRRPHPRAAPGVGQWTSSSPTSRPGSASRSTTLLEREWTGAEDAHTQAAPSATGCGRRSWSSAR